LHFFDKQNKIMEKMRQAPVILHLLSKKPVFLPPPGRVGEGKTGGFH
jgi:hypothetical protein